MKRKFNTIKKSRKKSKDIDEKIEYLNKECQKTGIQEVMTTSDIYVGTEEIPNTTYTDFTSASFNGLAMGQSGTTGEGIGGAYTGSVIASEHGLTPGIHDYILNLKGVAVSPPHPVSGQRRYGSTRTGMVDYSPARPGVKQGNSDRVTGNFRWIWNPNENNSDGTTGNWFPLEYDTTRDRWAFWDDNFLGFGYLNHNLSDINFGSGNQSGADLMTLFSNLNIDGEDIGTPTTTLFTKDDLGNPDFLPINIPDLSKQAFDWLKDKAQDALDLLSNPFEPILDLLADLTGTSAEKDNVDDYMRNFVPELLAGNEPIGSTPDKPRDNSEVYDDETISDYEKIFQDYQSEINGEKDSLDISWETKYDLAQRDNSSIGNTTGTLDPEAGDGFIDNGDGTVTFRKAFDFDRYDDMAGSNFATTLGAMGYGIMSGIPGLLYRSGGKTPTMYTGITFNKETGKVIKNYKPNIKESLDESVKLGHFEPEALTVDIEKLRKGIMPEFPKDPPPEMINGYSSKSRLAPKKVEGEPFIKITKKDLARNHRLTDKEISDYMNDINMINDYIRKNPAELKYAMIRYPKDDPRLAQLNFKMDQMKAASDQYMDTHFPENQKLFNKLQDKIIKNMNQTDPKNFTGHKEAPKFTDDNSEMNEQRKRIITKHFKKKVILKKLFRKA